MSCYAMASATVLSDRMCLLSAQKQPQQQATPILFSPASILACRNPPTCILGGYTNFVGAAITGVATESCFPYILRDDGGTKYDQATGRMFSDQDIVPFCPATANGGDGQCPGQPEQEYTVVDVKPYGVYRIHGNIDAVRLAIYQGGSVTAAISWSEDDNAHFMAYSLDNVCGREGASSHCSKFDPKGSPINLQGRSTLPSSKSGGHAAGHALVIVGWECADAECAAGWWLVQNSWGESWGDQGYGRIAFGSMDIESLVFFIDVAGVYDESVRKVIQNPALGTPDQVLRRSKGVVHDHGGGLLFVKAVKAGIIKSWQDPTAYGPSSHVVTLKWKATVKATCLVRTSREGKDVRCPLQANAQTWKIDQDLSGCLMKVAGKSLAATGCSSTDSGSTWCAVSTSAAHDGATDPMSLAGSTGLTSHESRNELPSRFIGHLILSGDISYTIFVKCTSDDDSGDPPQTSTVALSINPTPKKQTGCGSRTLDAMGECFLPTVLDLDEAKSRTTGTHDVQKPIPPPPTPELEGTGKEATAQSGKTESESLPPQFQKMSQSKAATLMRKMKLTTTEKQTAVKSTPGFKNLSNKQKLAVLWEKFPEKRVRKRL